MKTWKVFSLAGLVLTIIYVWTWPAQAQFFGRDGDYREAVQRQRIHNGVESGTLTPQEAWKLSDEQRRIQEAEDRMRADGGLNHRERARLDQMQEKADRRIYRENHDKQMVFAGHRNHRNPHYRQWQDHHRRDQRHHYSRRDNGCDRRSEFRPNHGDRNRFHRMPHRDRRFAWGH